MKKKILITGIYGFLGSHLAIHLKDQYEIIGLVNSFKKSNRINEYNFKIHSSKTDNLESIFIENKIYAILHVATVYDKKEESLINLINTNVLLPIKLVELSKKYKVKSFLNTDSFFNNDKYKYDYLSYYTLSKKQILEWLKLFSFSTNCKVVNLKIFHMYGEYDSLNKFIPFIIEKIKKEDPFIDLTPGNQIRDFIYVKDVVRAYEVILNSIDKLDSFQEFEIGSGQSYKINYLLALIKEITKSNIDLRFGAIPYRNGEIMISNVINFDLTKKYGWKPTFNLVDGLNEYLKQC